MNKKYILALIIVLFIWTVDASIIGKKIEEISDEKDVKTIHLDEEFWINDERSSSLDDVDWWTMYHHDKENSGYSSSNAPHTSNIRWTQEAPYYIDLSSPAIVDGRLYIGASDTFFKEEFLFKRNIDIFDVIKEKKQSRYYYGLYCYNAETGSLIWEHLTLGMVDSSPAVYNDRVYFVSTNYRFATLHCVYAQNGSELWNDSINNFSFCSPTVANGFVYVMSLNTDNNSGNVYCYGAETGHREWMFPLATNEYPPLLSPTVAFSNGLVYFISFKEENSHGTLYCLDAETGIEEWHFDLGWNSEFYSASPVCVNGMVFACGLHEVTSRERVFCLDAETGDTNWVYYLPSPSYILSTPACDFERLYFVAIDVMYLSTIWYCIDIESGRIQWSRLLGSYETIMCSPAVADGKLYFGSWDGTMYCLDTTDSHTIWTYGTYDMIVSSPAIADNRMYIATLHYVYAFEDPPNDPPNKPTITGEINGKAGESYAYTFVATDPDVNNVWYFIEWGDNQFEEWIGSYESGEAVMLEHSWDEEATYTIKAKAKDIYDAESEWATLTVSMPKNKVLTSSLFLRFLERFPILQKFLILIN